MVIDINFGCLLLNATKTNLCSSFIFLDKPVSSSSELSKNH